MSMDIPAWPWPEWGGEWEDEDDAEARAQRHFDRAMAACGREDETRSCLLAGTEHCQFRCPFHDAPPDHGTKEKIS